MPEPSTNHILDNSNSYLDFTVNHSTMPPPLLSGLGTGIGSVRQPPPPNGKQEKKYKQVPSPQTAEANAVIIRIICLEPTKHNK